MRSISKVTLSSAQNLYDTLTQPTSLPFTVIHDYACSLIVTLSSTQNLHDTLTQLMSSPLNVIHDYACSFDSDAQFCSESACHIDTIYELNDTLTQPMNSPLNVIHDYACSLTLKCFCVIHAGRNSVHRLPSRNVIAETTGPL